MLRHPNPSEQGLRGGDDHSRRVPGTEPRRQGPGPQGRRGSREAWTHGYEVRFIKKSLGDFDESALWDPTDEDEGDADAASHTDLARAFLEWLEDRGHRLVRAEKKIYWYDRSTACTSRARSFAG